MKTDLRIDGAIVVCKKENRESEEIPGLNL